MQQANNTSGNISPYVNKEEKQDRSLHTKQPVNIFKYFYIVLYNCTLM